ncbi:FosX/FosE/FosI family fosfomycin resistance hydrolase [Sporomusa sp.]|uniref:FosX/FosE/FosI family fosfomycin resistance hydrolase n=1 Tax=Sporomusa sp. TaxID=2078658 RepID=UPI002B934420|nr:FosX/FosE/FosI family fosfomycin resistance hydrolase [Sporomusa sp.]HWR42157.1 FosX/FosE/FosI family fosfomycin resistance hydrolase [Sporomusa sp.]
MIEGISHLTFIVKDLERASAFWTAIFEAEEVYASGDKMFSLTREKFFLISGQWIAVMEGDSLPTRTYNHIAFKIPEEEFAGYEARVRESGVDFKEPRPRVEGEGRSLYFYDFDNHLFELHTGTLSERLCRYADNKEANFR